VRAWSAMTRVTPKHDKRSNHTIPRFRNSCHSWFQKFRTRSPSGDLPNHWLQVKYQNDSLIRLETNSLASAPVQLIALFCPQPVVYV
jgi:hypothetical protein